MLCILDILLIQFFNVALVVIAYLSYKYVQNQTARTAPVVSTSASAPAPAEVIIEKFDFVERPASMPQPICKSDALLAKYIAEALEIFNGADSLFRKMFLGSTRITAENMQVFTIYMLSQGLKIDMAINHHLPIPESILEEVRKSEILIAARKAEKERLESVARREAQIANIKRLIAQRD
jgi:hypothetical protein